MNHIYRLCWNRTLRACVVASELAKGGHGAGAADGGQRPGRRRLRLAALAGALVLSSLAWAGNAPTGGQVVAGSGQIAQSGHVTTIHQQSDVLSLNWQGFDIGAQHTVDFLQPGAGSIAVNRVLGNSASEILGHLNANGQVWLINPNGVLFGAGAQVHAGGILASTLDLDDATVGTGSVRFAGSGRGSVVNRGSLTAHDGGYVALLGNTVSNQGTVRAQLGTVALGAGTALTLTFDGGRLMHLQVDASTVKSLVENRELVVADGGQVLMTAGARAALIDSAVNNAGIVQARTVAEHDGVITLLSGMQAGTTQVAGMLDASAPDGGNGGFIETSGAHVKIADGAKITTQAATGKTGTWLIDPNDFTIAASGGDITGSTLAANLAGTSVAYTSNDGASGSAGNVNVNDAVAWSANTTLTLTASHDVVINGGGSIINTGASAKTVLNAGNAFINNAGAAALGGHWSIYSASPAGNTLGGLTPGFAQYNAPQGTAAAAGATGNGLFYSAAAAINITGFSGAPTKGYDGTTNLLPGNLAYSLSGGGSGDALQTITGGYSQSDVGSGLTVKAPTASSAYRISNGGVPVFGYTVSGAGSASSTSGSITQAVLGISITDSALGAYSLSKVYDGTNSITLNAANYQFTGVAAGESITVNQPSAVGYGTLSGGAITPIADVNTLGGTIPAGGGGPVAIAAIFTNTNFKAGAGTKLGNYKLDGLTATGTGAITQAPVYLGGVMAQNRTYDATTVAPINKGNASIFGIVNNDPVTLDTSAGAGSFADANAGSGKAVTLTGFSLTGSDPVKVADYNLIIPATLTANIARAPLAVYGVTVTDKVYDGSTATTPGELNLSGVNFTGTQGSDSLTLDQSGASGHFSQADVGSELGVSVGGFQIRNADSTINNNYTVGSVQAGSSASPVDLTANITPRPLTIRFSGSADKIYDGTSYATLHTGDFAIDNVVAGEAVTVRQAPANYNGADVPNVGSDTVTAHIQASDLDFDPLTPAKVGNYTFNTTVTGAGNILPAPLSIVIDGNPTKTYDGTSAATLTAGNFHVYGVIPGEGVSIVGPFTANYYNGAPGTPESNAGGWGVEATLTAGNYAFTPGGVNPSGTLGNYTLPNPVLGFGTIDPKPISGQITAGLVDAGVHHLDKVYDGNTAISLDASNVVFSGFLNGDSASVNGPLAGVFATKDVGKQPLSALIDKANVTVTCNGGGSGCLGNYTYDGVPTPTHSLNDPSWSLTARGTGEIFAKDLYITLTGVAKTYDGNTTVLPLENSNFIVHGYVDNDTGGVGDSGWVTGEGAVITPTASFTYGSPNVSWAGGTVQSDINVKGSLTPHNYAPTGATLLSNYNLVYTIDENVGAITPAQLFVSGVRVRDKIYDGGDGALVSIRNGQMAGLADVDKNAAAITLTVGTGTASTADGVPGSATGTLIPNSDGTFTPAGSPVSGTFAGVNAGNGQTVSTTFSLGGTSALNYTLVTPSLTASITPRPLTVSGITADDKTYDGGTAATLTYPAPTFNAASGTGPSATGLLAADAGNVAVDPDPAKSTASFATANANVDPTGALLNSGGSAIAVSTNLQLTGSAASNYVLTQPGLTANIRQKEITLSLAGPIEKYYDGTTSVTIPKGNDQSVGNPSTGYHTDGWVGGEGALITQTHSAFYHGPDASVDGSGLPIGGGDGSIDVTANLVSSDWQPNPGTSLVNYALPATVTAHVGKILPLPLDLTATRVYDATTNIYASLSGNVTNDDNANVFGTLTGVNGDSFTVTGTGTASSKNVGTYTNGAGFGLGSLALAPVTGNVNNYTLIGGVDRYTITKAPLNIAGGAVNTKVYDGTTAATVAGATLTAGNTKGDVLGSDVVSLVTDGGGNIAGTFNDKNAGSGKPVTINASAIAGADAGNYQIQQPSPGLTGTITQRPVTIDGSRAYDATNTVAGSSGAITWLAPGAVVGDADSGVVAGDTVKVNGGTGSVASANVGTYHTDGSGDGTFDAGTLTLDNANYVISTTGNQFAITPHVITLTGTRVYDGTPDAAATLFAGASCGAGCVTLAGVGSETLDLSGTGTLSSADVAGPTGAPTQVAFDGGIGSPFGFSLVGNAGGAKAGNYALKGGVTITPYVLSFNGTRVYDGTKKVNATDLRDATAGSLTIGTATFSGLGADQFTVGGTGVLSSANAGSYGGGAASGVGGTPADATQIGVSGLTLTAVSGKAGNYTLVGGTDSYTIAKAPVTLTGIRRYDAGTTAAGGGVIASTGAACAAGSTCWVVNGVVAADRSQLAVTGSTGSGAIPSADVGEYGNGKAGGTFASTGLVLGGSAASNYLWAPSTSDEFIVTPYVLNLSGTRVYDGGTSADAGLFGPGGLLTGVAGETVQLTGSGSLSSKNVNGGTPYTGTGIAGAASGQGFNLDTLALTAGGSGKAGNYTLVGGSDSLTLTKLAITVDATAADKPYDGTTTATVTGLTSTGVLGGDTVTFANTGADFDDKNAAAVKTVTVDGISAGGADGGNYAVNATATTTAAVTPRVLDLSGTRAYDATTVASAKAFGNKDGTINGVTVAGVTEVLNLGGAGVVGSADADTYARNPGSTAAPAAGSTDFGLGSLLLGDNGGTLARNYTLVGGSDRFVITPAGVALSVTIAGGRQYDGTKNAQSADFGAGGVITTSLGETLDLSGTGTLSSANVGSYKISDGSLGFGSLALNDGSGAHAGKASNYALTDGAFTVTRRVLGLSGTRVYDGGTDADAGDITGITGLIGAETLGLTGTGVLSGKNVNGGTPYTGTGGAAGPQGFDLGTLALTDGSGLASNYTLAGGTDNFVLTPLAITVAATAADKPYDGSTAATVTSLTSGGVLGGDTVVFDHTTANFTDADAGPGKTVTVGGITSTGTDAGNYTINTTATTTATITPKVLDLTGTRVYDTTTDAAAGQLALGGLVGGQTLVLSGLGQVTSKNVGSYTGVDFTLGTLALADGTGRAGNYTLVGGIDRLTITPATLTVGGITAASKTYDGTTATTVSGGTLTGVLGGDHVTLSVGGTGTFATPNAGTGIAVSVATGIGGSDVGNYVLASSGGAVADIYRKVLDLSGTRVYDGTTDAGAGDLVIGGLVGRETLTLSGTGRVGDKHVDTDKPFTSLGSLTLGNGGNGGLAGNYTLVGGIDTLTITPKTIRVDATGTDKVYDGTTPDAVTLAGNGLIPGDAIDIGYGEAHFDDPAVGNGKRVTVTGVDLSGDDARNYVLADTTVYTQANITGSGGTPPPPPAGGLVEPGVLASLYGVLAPTRLPTPYGVAPQVTLGTFTGNQKRLHEPVERNVSRGDFISGLALKLVDGGVSMPAGARP